MAGEPRKSERYHVPAVVAAFRMLTALADHEGAGVTQAALTQQLELSKSTAHNLLATLEDLGMVQRDADSRLYGLGGGLIALGHAAARHVRVVSAASDRLPDLASEAKLSFAVAQVIDDGLTAQVVERAYQQDGVHIGIPLGSSLGIFDGAVGKCLLASLEPWEADRLVRTRVIPSHTRATLVKPADLLREIESAREQGWAASIQELNENNAVAAPVVGPSGQAEAILFALGFPSQLPPQLIPEIGGLLRRTAAQITVACGGRLPEAVAAGHDGTNPNGPHRAQESNNA